MEKIFFVGSQGTGKSTLVKDLSKHLHSYKIYNSLTEKFLKNKEDQLPTSVNFMEFQQRLYLYTFNLYVNEKYFISSRSVLDMNAYIRYAEETLRDSRLSDLRKWNDNFKDYLFNDKAIYFYTPIEFEINTNNSNRINDKNYQKKIDTYIKEEILTLQSKKYNINIITLSGNLENRINLIRNSLKEIK